MAQARAAAVLVWVLVIGGVPCLRSCAGTGARVLCHSLVGVARLQKAAGGILESIYEADSSACSPGYRRVKPGAREISQQLAQEFCDKTHGWVVEAD